MTPITLRLPWPPSLNTAYPHRMIDGRPVRVPSTKCQRYHKEVKSVLPGMAPLECRLKASYYFYPPDRRKRDLSNHIKVVEDALCAKPDARPKWKQRGIIVDDELFDEIHAYRMKIEKGGALIIIIEESTVLHGEVQEQLSLNDLPMAPLLGAPM